MVAGVIINDQNGTTTFDGTQRIPKILVAVAMQAGDTIRSAPLPRPLNGQLFYYFQSDFIEDEPYYQPLVYNFKVSVTSTTATVEYIKVYNAMPNITIPFTVYIGEY